jgi:hypothetical protein
MIKLRMSPWEVFCQSEIELKVIGFLFVCFVLFLFFGMVLEFELKVLSLLGSYHKSHTFSPRSLIFKKVGEFKARILAEFHICFLKPD